MRNGLTWLRCFGIGLMVMALAAGAARQPARGMNSQKTDIPGRRKPLRLTFIANEGVLVSSGDKKVLIDALFDKPNAEYRAPSKDIFLMLPGTPPKVFQGQASDAEALSLSDNSRAETERFFGQARPGLEPVKFLPEILTSQRHPHGQLAFSPDGRSVFWSAMLQDGPEQTIFHCAFDGETYSRPDIAPFAAASGDGGPSFSSDGRRLFFSAELPPAGDPARRPSAICYVERAGSRWTEPRPIASTVDTRMTKGQVSVARNGNIYFSGRVLTEQMPCIYICRYSAGEYLPPEKLGGPLASAGLLVDPWIDPDERFLLLSCSPEEGPPMPTDIGISFRQADGTWSEPARLGGSVNTPAFERFPSLSRDGRALFFIRSFGKDFVSDQAYFYWVDAKIIDPLRR
jgi:hypothetical protein